MLSNSVLNELWNLWSTMSWNLLGTWYYFSQLVNSVSPTVNFLYDNVLTNPIFYGILLVLLVLSLFTFSD